MRSRLTFCLLLSVAVVGVSASDGYTKLPPKKEPKADGKSLRQGVDSLRGIDAEPRANGKALSEWMKLLQGTDPKARAQAAQAIGKIGPAAKVAVPALIVAAADDRV